MWVPFFECSRVEKSVVKEGNKPTEGIPHTLPFVCMCVCPLFFVIFPLPQTPLSALPVYTLPIVCVCTSLKLEFLVFSSINKLLKFINQHHEDFNWERWQILPAVYIILIKSVNPNFFWKSGGLADALPWQKLARIYFNSLCGSLSLSASFSLVSDWSIVYITGKFCHLSFSY